MNVIAELALDELIEGGLFAGEDMNVIRGTDGDIVVFTFSFVVFIGSNGASTRHNFAGLPTLA